MTICLLDQCSRWYTSGTSAEKEYGKVSYTRCSSWYFDIRVCFYELHAVEQRV